MNNHEPQIDAARGDIGLSRYLKETLRVLSANTKDRDLQRQLAEISSGRESLHSLLHSDGFMRIVDQALPDEGRAAGSRTPEELHQLAAAGEALLERFRQLPPEDNDSVPAADEQVAEEPHSAQTGNRVPESHVIPGTRKPNRDRVVGPADDEDDEDEYFRGRQERGWLS